MVKDHSDSELGNPLPPHGLLFSINSKGSFICTIPDRITHTMAFVTPVVEHWLEREIAQWVHPTKDRSDDPSHHVRRLLPQSYLSLPSSPEILGHYLGWGNASSHKPHTPVKTRALLTDLDLASNQSRDENRSNKLSYVRRMFSLRIYTLGRLPPLMVPQSARPFR